ncbi:putative small secreted protein [Scopulibacillus daqui]|uniref:Small secreted protein n=1 Tax=Scopulibacillus daqui TaxID=1469162 RepID=A0ABS2PZJ8_9BACL|nr:PepSY domain-containing protein [Scopulibacillus daqui]MBM7644869.1 putative small secreted protein [Scopulibacillus daqui]
MKIKNIAIAFGVGLAGGYVLQKALQKSTLSPEQVMQLVKKTAKKALDIDGAWIYLSPENYQQNGLTYKVYKGGLTAKNNENLEHYDFIADASTGTILDLKAQ